MKKLMLGVLLLCGCPKAATDAPTPASWVSEAKKALAERERRLTSFKLVIDSTEGENRAHHEVAFRAPNKSRAHLTAPQDFELAFDGSTLVRMFAAEQKYEVVPLELPVADRAFTLASQFLPFVPEGYRAPLLPLTGVEGKKLTRADGSEAVELTVRPASGIIVRYLLRLPAGDFLEKRTTADGRDRVLSVEKEQCDEKLALCVPTKLVERMGNEVLGTTEVTSALLNPQVPQDWFAPKMPAGWPSPQPSPPRGEGDK